MSVMFMGCDGNIVPVVEKFDLKELWINQAEPCGASIIKWDKKWDLKIY